MAGVEENARAVNDYLRSKIRGSPAELYDAANHLIAHGGKRLRPYMLIKSCEILGGTGSDAMPAAGAIETIHNFTLVHDDIMDNDDVRHGVPAVHKKFGVPIAILAGDVLFARAYQMIADSGLPAEAVTQLTSRLAKACADVCEGQLLDMRMASSDMIPTQRAYVRMVGKKTAALFEVSCAMGAVCAAGSPGDTESLASFGRNMGIAFQITDDLIGVMGDSSVTKKPVGNDLREGKKSLPILAALKSAEGSDREIILKAFGNRAASGRDIDSAVDVIR